MQLPIFLFKLCILMCYCPLVDGHALSQLEKMLLIGELHDAVNKSAGIYWVEFTYDTRPPELVDSISITETGKIEGDLNVGNLEINGRFSVGHSLSNTTFALRGGSLKRKVPIDARWGGDANYRRLHTLMTHGANEPKTRLYLIVGNSVDLLDWTFLGPFSYDERDKIEEMVHKITDIKVGKNPSVDYRRDLLPSPNEWLALLGIVMIQKHDKITAMDFASNELFLTPNDMTLFSHFCITSHSFLEKDAWPLFLEALLKMLTHSNEEKKKAISIALGELVKTNAYNLKTQLSQSGTFKKFVEESIDSLPVESELRIDYQRLKDTIFARLEHDPANANPGTKREK